MTSTYMEKLILYFGTKFSVRYKIKYFIQLAHIISIDWFYDQKWFSILAEQASSQSNSPEIYFISGVRVKKLTCFRLTKFSPTFPIE